MLSKIRSFWYWIVDDPIHLLVFLLGLAGLVSVAIGLMFEWIIVVAAWGAALLCTIAGALLELIFPCINSTKFMITLAPIIAAAILFFAF